MSQAVSCCQLQACWLAERSGKALHLVRALLWGRVGIGVQLPPLQQPAVDLLIHLTMHMLSWPAAFQSLGWVRQQLPSPRQ